MGLRSSKPKRTEDPPDLETESAPLTRQQHTQAQTAASSSQPEKGAVDSGTDKETGKKVDEAAPSGMQKTRRVTPKKQLYLELDRKRKAPVGLPSLAVNCGGPSSQISKKFRRCDQAAATSTRLVIQDNGTGHAMVGRRVKRGVRRGRIVGYNLSLKQYQVKYGDGTEEAIEWRNLKPWLVESDTEDASLNDDTRSSMSRRSLRSNNRWKKVNDLVYGNRPMYQKRRRRPSSRM